jgi:hypothetical protein
LAFVGLDHRSGRASAVAGGYVAYYGWYEIRVLAGADADPIIDRAIELQTWLQNSVVPDDPSTFAIRAVIILALSRSQRVSSADDTPARRQPIGRRTRPPSTTIKPPCPRWDSEDRLSRDPTMTPARHLALVTGRAPPTTPSTGSAGSLSDRSTISRWSMCASRGGPLRCIGSDSWMLRIV